MNQPTACLLGGSGKPWASTTTSLRRPESLRPSNVTWNTPATGQVAAGIPRHMGCTRCTEFDCDAPRRADRARSPPRFVVARRGTASNSSLCSRAPPLLPFSAQRRAIRGVHAVCSVWKLGAVREQRAEAGCSSGAASGSWVQFGSGERKRGAVRPLGHSREVVAASRRRARRPRSPRSTRPASAAVASRDARSRASSISGASAAAV
jgi:hypothetical protein